MTKIDVENNEKQETAEDVNTSDIKEDTTEKPEETEGSEAKESEEEKAEKEEQKEDESVRYMRLMADFQNYKKRVEKEKKDLYSYANEKLVTEQLVVLDNFERALGQDTADESFKEGMELIFKQLKDVLEKAGLAEIPALGEDFDPNFHNAVMTEETEEYESGKVSGVMQKGYTLNGKVIRPSMVKVAG